MATCDGGRDVLAAQAGTSEDIRFLRSLPADTFRRFVFVLLVPEPPRHRFDGPIGLYRTDRPVTTDDGVMPLGEDDKVLVSREEGRAAFLARLEAWAGITLTNGAWGARLCAYACESVRRCGWGPSVRARSLADAVLPQLLEVRAGPWTGAAAAPG